MIMTMAKSKEEIILIGNGEQVIELTGADREAFIADREARAQEALLLEAEYKAKQDARDSAIKKLGEIAGLTKEELDAIL
jgi:hypothetical protein